MHDLEPFYNWRHRYSAEEDERSPFFGTEHSEFEFTNAVYDHAIHPQWDAFGSETLYLKVLFTDYDAGVTIIELIGEWNDLLGNDVMFLKRDLIEPMMSHGIDKFILIGEPIAVDYAGFGFSKNAPELRDAVADIVDAMIADGTYGKIFAKWEMPYAEMKKTMINGEPRRK